MGAAPWTEVTAPRRSRATAAASVLTLAVTAPFVYLAVDLALVVWGGRSLDASSRSAAAQLELSSVELANVVTIGFFVVVLVSVYAVVLAVGLLRRAEWARHAAILTFLFFGLLLVPMSIAGYTHEPPSANAWLGLVLGVADLAIVGLLVTRGASDDFEDADWLRWQRQARGPDRVRPARRS